MGTYVNPTSALFQNALRSQYYVDKSNLIGYTNKVLLTEEKYVCVSRPRRFGKTMAVNMLAAYYSNKSDAENVFAELSIKEDSTFSIHANKYNVIRIDMTKMWNECNSTEEMLSNLKRCILWELLREFPNVSYMDKNNFLECFNDVYNETGIGFVILIDEWDSIFRQRQHDTDGQNKYLNFLRNWLKDREYIVLAYMTGILPIKKYGEHSALNMFTEFSMENAKALSEFVGFTNQEVGYLCEQECMDFNEVKTWYDGYLLKKKVLNKEKNRIDIVAYEIYNPVSVIKAMLHHEVQSYWNKTETYEALKRYILLNMDGLRDIIIKLMAGEQVRISTQSFSNDMTTFSGADDVLTLLIHLGYLGYDSEESKVFIPNNEIREEFATAVKTDKDLGIIYKAIWASDELLNATLIKNEAKVAECLENAHYITSIIQYNDENALSYVISFAYYTARKYYNVVREMPTGKGFADMVFLPRPHHPELPAIIVELKYNHSAMTAIKQIKKNNYLKALEDYIGKVLLVGISYTKNVNDKNYKNHKCKIEEIEILHSNSI